MKRLPPELRRTGGQPHTCRGRRCQGKGQPVPVIFVTKDPISGSRQMPSVWWPKIYESDKVAIEELYQGYLEMTVS